jgi:hypothetical protein
METFIIGFANIMCCLIGFGTFLGVVAIIASVLDSIDGYNPRKWYVNVAILVGMVVGVSTIGGLIYLVLTAVNK